MSKANYKFFTRLNFSTNCMNFIKYQKTVLSNGDRYIVNISRNLGGCKLF